MKTVTMIRHWEAPVMTLTINLTKGNQRLRPKKRYVAR